jgi:hypothetical protein
LSVVPVEVTTFGLAVCYRATAKTGATTKQKQVQLAKPKTKAKVKANCESKKQKQKQKQILRLRRRMTAKKQTSKRDGTLS